MPLDQQQPQSWEPELESEVKIILWHWPEGEALSHGGFSCVPQRDIGHPMARHRFIATVPRRLVHRFVGGPCGAELLE